MLVRPCARGLLMLLGGLVLFTMPAAEALCSVPESSGEMAFTNWLHASSSWATDDGAAASCVSVTNATLLPPSVTSFGQPDFSSLQPSPADPGQRLPIYLQNVTFQTDCSTVQQYQQYVCRLDSERLSGAVEITSPYWLYIYTWLSDVVVSRDVNITCQPPSPANGTSPTPSLPPLPSGCLVTGVSSAAGLLRALDWMQRAQGGPANQTRLILIVVQTGIAFSQELVSPYWPTGFLVTGNVSIAAAAFNTLLDWAGLQYVLNVSPLPSARLLLTRFMQVNMPHSFAPPVNTGFHNTGSLTLNVWPVARRLFGNQFTIKSCTIVLAYDSFSFWAYFLTVAGSPDAAVNRLASWTAVRGFGLDLTISDGMLRMVDIVAPSTIWINLTIANPTNPNHYPVTVQNIGLQDIAASSSFVPPSTMFQVASLVDIQYAVNYTTNNQWTDQFGQFIILCANITGNASAPSMLPARASGGSAVSQQDDHAEDHAFFVPPAPPLLAAVPPPPLASVFGLPAVLLVDTTFTVWPNDSVCWDFQRVQTPVVQHSSQQKVTVRQLTLMNLPVAQDLPAPGGMPYSSLTTGCWAFQFDIANSLDSSAWLALQNVTIHVPPAELQLYFHAASLQQPDAPAGALQLSADGAALMRQWISKQQVTSWGAHWIAYSSLQTLRFQGTNINITDSAPPACAASTAMPAAAEYGAYTSSSDSSGGLPAWAIGVIVGVACAALLGIAAFAFVVVTRRRRRRQQQKQKAMREETDLASKASAGQLMMGLSDASGRSSLSTLAPAAAAGSLPMPGMGPNGSSADCTGEGFSNEFSSNMIDRASTTASNTSQRINPESIFSQLASQNNGLRDEQLSITGTLGRGGHGVVYKGIWKGLPVVMIVHEEEHEKARRQMLEAMISTSLSHPNIVVTYTYDLKRLMAASMPSLADNALIAMENSSGSRQSLHDVVGATAWQLLIVQELCSGGPIRTLITKDVLALKPRASCSHATQLAHLLQLALDVALGLEHLHAKNVVHSDLNPSNVLLQACPVPRCAGLLWSAKVADFGLSVAFEAGRSHVSQRFAGTPFYIAPETQYAGIVSKQSDVFAFGILLAEMASGPAEKTPPPLAPPLEQPSDLPPDSRHAQPVESDSTPVPRNLLQVLMSSDNEASGSNVPLLTRRTVLAVEGSSASVASPSAVQVTPVSALRAANDDRPSPSPPLPPPPAQTPSTNNSLSTPLVSTQGDGRSAGPSLAALPQPGGGGSGGGEPSSQRLLGGEGGRFGAARALPPLPAECPLDFGALVAECLDPLPAKRPPIGTVVQRLRAMAQVHVPGFVTLVGPDNGCGGGGTATPPGVYALATLYE